MRWVFLERLWHELRGTDDRKENEMAINHSTGDARQLSYQRRMREEQAAAQGSNDVGPPVAKDEVHALLSKDDAHAHGIRFVVEKYGSGVYADDSITFQQRFEGEQPAEGEPVFVFPFSVPESVWEQLGSPSTLTVTFESGVPDA